MNKVFNWTVGSFFRSIGRILSYIVIGGIIGLILSNNFHWKKIRLSDLFLIEHVKADSYEGLTFEGFAHPFNSRQVGQKSALITGGVDQSSWDQLTSWQYTIQFDNNITIPSSVKQIFIPSSFSFTSGDSEQQFMEFSFRVEISDTNGSVKYCIADNGGVWCEVTPGKTYRSIRILVTTIGNAFSSYNINDYWTMYSDLGNQIIQSQNQTAQDIINSQNQTTQDIINNQEAQTNATIESQQVCNKIDKVNIKDDGYYLNNSNGQLGTQNQNYGVTDYIKIDSQSKIKVIEYLQQSIPTCFYNVNKTYISCILANTMQLNSNLTIPNNASYVRFSINKANNKPQFQICKNGNQAMTDAITDDNVSSSTSSASSFFDNFSTTDHGGLSGIITAPLSAIQSITSKTCSPLVLPLPYIDSDLTLPCMRTIYEQFFGGFMSIYDVITLGIVSYWILVRIFNLVKDFKNPEHDEIEVVDL